MPEPVKAPSDPGQGEEYRHHGKPQSGRQRHVQAIARLQRNRRARADDHREQRHEEQGRLGVQSVGQKPQAQRRCAGLPGTRVLANVDAPGPGSQALDRYPGQVQGAQHFQNAEQQDRLLYQQTNAQQRVGYVHQNTGADTHGTEQGISTALEQGLAQHNRKIGPGACHGQQVHQGNRQKFRPVSLHGLCLPSRAYLTGYQ